MRRFIRGFKAAGASADEEDCILAGFTRPYRTTSENHVKVSSKRCLPGFVPNAAPKYLRLRSECPNCRSKSAPAPAVRVEPVSASTPAPATVTTRPPVSPVLIAIGSAVGILAVLAILYLYVLPRGSAKSTTAALENPGTAASSGGGDCPSVSEIYRDHRAARDGR